MSHGIKSKRKYVHISMKEIGHNLDGPPKCKKELHNVFGCPSESWKRPDLLVVAWQPRGDSIANS